MTLCSQSQGNGEERYANLLLQWLGPDSDDPGAAKLDSAKEVVERLASVPPEKWDSDLPDDLYDPGIWKILGMEPTLHWEWLAFAGFILRGWFSRIWVVQERWAAKRMVVFCGDWVIDWKVLSDGITTLRATGMDGKLNSKVEEIVSRNSPTGSGTRFVTNRIRNQFIFTAIDRSQPLKLEKLLAYSRYFNATVADDRVYAVLGMVCKLSFYLLCSLKESSFIPTTWKELRKSKCQRITTAP